tara:strand:- start:2645 stop:3376 length:732 start_codon:yes stop_codon:yes gene_type:complete
MNWTDEGIFLSGRKFGESSSIVSVFTRDKGRHLGLVQGGAGRRLRPVLQLGNILQCRWNSRLEDNLGNFQLELIRPVAAVVMEQPVRLSGVTAICGLIDVLIPERDPCKVLFDHTMALFKSFLSDDDYLMRYILWELDLLTDIGFGLNLEECVVSGVREDLAWISPKSGGAVSRKAGLPYAGKLLPLPGFIVHGGKAKRSEILEGFSLTGHFLNRAATSHGVKLVYARSRFVEQLSRKSLLAD